jgi:DNA-binding Lrp family transcriptional regulator
MVKQSLGTLETETVCIADAFKAARRIAKQLDASNIKILSAMWEFGPRNLLEVSRRTGVPFTSVYNRVKKLEAESGRIAYLVPTLSRIGMTRVVALAAARSGYERQLSEALKIPNFWSSTNSCEGSFTYHSVHSVPVKRLQEFRAYMTQLGKMGLTTDLKIIRTGEQYPNFPDFRYYNAVANEWTVPWGEWFDALSTIKPSETLQDPSAYPTLVDKRDLLLIKELEKNARKSFAELAPILGISLQGVKYRYDKKLVPRGIVRNFAFAVYPYPVEVSSYHEVMLEFTNEMAMRRFFSLQEQLFFILASSKVIGRNTLLVRTCILESQLRKMFDFFSEMAKNRMLESYSAVRLSSTGTETQTISYELFDDEKGWTFDLDHCTSKLRQLVSKSPPTPRKTQSIRQ